MNNTMIGYPRGKHYNLLHANDPAVLVAAVNQAIKHGYEPLGGICMAMDVYHTSDGENTNEIAGLEFCQAIIKK